MSDITDRISFELDFLGLTRADLSRATGIPESTIRNWIRGTAPQAEPLYKVARFLNVSLEYLITGQDAPPRNERKNLDFLDSFLSLPEDEQNEIKELIKIKCKKCAKSVQKVPEKKAILFDL